VDPVSEAMLAWLEQRATRGGRRPRSFPIDENTQSALTRVVHGGVEDAVRDVVTPALQQTALTTLLRASPASRSVRAVAGAKLSQTFMAYLAPQFEALTDLGLDVDSSRLAQVLTRHIGIHFEGAARDHTLPPPMLSLLARPPGKPFDIDELLDSLDDDEDDQDDDDQDDDDSGQKREPDEAG